LHPRRDSSDNESKMTPAFPAAETGIRQLIANGKQKTALDRAKEVHKAYRNAASEALLVDAYAARIQALIAQNLTVEANSLLSLVEERYPAAADRLARLTASNSARAGKLDELLRPLNDPALSPDRRAAIERAIAEQVSDPGAIAGCEALPLEHPLRQAAAALRDAFNAVTTGLVSDEALAIPEVSRRSPLAPWRMLVLAIAAFYRREDQSCRKYLAAIPPESAPARLIAPMLAMLDGQPLTSGLLSQVTGNAASLKRAVEVLERNLEEGGHDAGRKTTLILNSIRTAVQECRQHAPGQLERFRQHVEVRASRAGIARKKVFGALGGPPLEDAYYYRLAARSQEATGDLYDVIIACALWNDFRLAATRAGWFTSNGPEAATLYLHMANLLSEVPEELIRTFEGVGFARGKAQRPEDTFYVHAGQLYERACVLDPVSEAFSQWMKWANRQPLQRAERVAEAWHKALPRDLEPILHLMRALEKRGAFSKALHYLARAERIDGVNIEVRRARMRILAANVMAQLKAGKPALAEDRLREIAALPQAQQGDRPAFVAALRYLVSSARGEGTVAAQSRAEVEQILGSRLAASLLISSLAISCKRGGLEAPGPVKKFAAAERSRLPADLARLASLARDAEFKLSLARDWLSETARQFPKVSGSLDSDEFRILGELAIELGQLRFAHTVSAAGLSRGGKEEAEFMFLRARALPESHFERRMVCATAAAKLAKQHSDFDLVGKAVEFLRGPFRDGSIEMTLEQAVEVAAKEKRDRAYPTGPPRGSAFGRVPPEAVCNCPDCRRERREASSKGWNPLDEFNFDDEDNEEGDDPFDALELPKGMPPELARILLEQLFARPGNSGPLPRMNRRRKRKKP
jgi:tetratricopeptide (TPR) repeat protein